MDETYLTFWLWTYRIAAIGIACTLCYALWKTIQNTVKSVRIIGLLKKKIRQNSKRQVALEKEISQLEKDIHELEGE